ncbi:unnamed protein product [Clonostachys rosea f. rosea IK726]|uniref:Uncharacterized protein n=2 Tax=Bionectria ochroleuca TaxID=29856 RepID=A0A0B7KFA8_BIOOC|nr:unnamed protein product [Clonostachys rosea f. rosea IK726]
MHFTKTIVSVLAVAGFAAAQADDLDRRDLENAREQYLAARDEYIEARDLYRRKEAPTHAGYCNKADHHSTTLWCLSRRTGTVCKQCKPKAKVMDPCTCPG